MKCMQVNGILIDRDVKFTIVHNGLEYVFIFIPYSMFKQQDISLINPEIIQECDTVVAYNSMANNSLEVYYIKILLSVIYFSYRISVEEKQKDLFILKEKLHFPEEVLEGITEKRYRKKESPVTRNWNVRGFFNECGIENINWCVTLGQNELFCDDFESYLSRAYGSDLCDSYDNRFKFYNL